MKKIFHKSTSSFPFAAFFYFILLILLLVNSIKAEVQDSYDRIMLQHPFFENHHWQISSDSVVFNVNTTFKTHTPQDVNFAGNDTIAWFTYRHNNKVYISKSVITYPASQFQSLTLSTDEPVELPSIKANSLSCLFVPNSISPSSLTFATSDSSTITIITIDGTSKTITYDTTGNFGVNDRIHSLYGTKNNNSLTPTGPSIWVGGENGLLSRILINTLPSINTEHFNLSGSEAITAISQDLCGTASGKLFKLQSSTFSELYSSNEGQITNINENNAITSNGTVLINQDDNWNSFSIGLDSATTLNRVFRRNGTGIEFLSKNWNYGILTLSDSTTKISSDNNQFNNQWSSNGSGYLTTDTNMDFEIYLFDIDKNTQLPQFSLNNKDLLKNDTFYISNTIPDRDYSSDTSDLADSIIKLSLIDNEIEITTTIRKRTYNPISFKNSWTFSEKTLNYFWEQDDSLKIKLYNDSIVIINNIGQVTKNSEVFANLMHTPKLYLKNKNIILPPNLKTSTSLVVYSLNGKILLRKEITPDTRSVSLPDAISNQVMIVTLYLGKGNWIKVPLIKSN